MPDIEIRHWQEIRSQLGSLSRRPAPTILCYRNKPLAIWVPLPEAHWTSAEKLVPVLVRIRERYLAEDHPHRGEFAIRVETQKWVHRNCALFGESMRQNVVTVITWYGNQKVIAVPVDDMELEDTYSLAEDLYLRAWAADTRFTYHRVDATPVPA